MLDFVVTLFDKLSNQLIEFFRRIYSLKQDFYKYFEKDKPNEVIRESSQIEYSITQGITRYLY